MKRFFVAILLFLLFAGYYFPQDIQTLQNKLQVKLEELKIKYNFPGATFALILKDGETIHLACGESSREEKTKMEPADLMFGGSTGKIFVAPVVLQLAAEKKINLDDKALKYFSDDEWFKKLPNYDSFTIRNLLNHTSGIPEYIIKETFGKDIVANPDKIWKPEELLSYIADLPPLFKSGEGWSYADANYIILGMIIERVCGDTYYNEMTGRILKPMKLDLTHPSTSRKLKGLIQGYSGDSPYLTAPERVLENGVCFINPQFEWTGGGLVTNPLDLAKWSRYLWRGDFLPDSLNNQMKQVVSFETGKPDNMGYGFGVMKFPSVKYGTLYTHGGIMFGYLSEVFYLEKYDAAIAMQINTDPFSGFFNSSLQQIVLRELIPFVFDNIENE